MLRRVLVANRGEIAVRIMRACQEIGLEPIAVFSDADRTAPHVRVAAEAYRLGPAPVAESYLSQERIIEIARQAHADGIHPGNGFLAENPDFAQAVLDAGLIWIGPPPSAIRMMGDKDAARQAMAAAGIPVIPGTLSALKDDEWVANAGRVGYPLLVKPAAGGGGKGMRRVYRSEDLLPAIQAASQEASASFGDNRVFLEKMVEAPRHVEMQVLADAHGNVIHLEERECSIQRRHQKLIEEAPSTALSDELRAEMGEVAVRVTRSAGYVGPGTVEFLLDQTGRYYFLEMNTRLQVEHPVTEMVTGVDIVKEMLRIAIGRKLRYVQSDIKINGWAIECRILTEDPFHNFVPSTGTIASLWEPTGPGVRLESGICQGMEITPYYDSLIAKLAVWGETRAEAILRMRRALTEYRIIGVKTTIPFHIQVMNSMRYQRGLLDTNFVDHHFTLDHTLPALGPETAAVAAALLAHQRTQQAILLQQSKASPWRVHGRSRAMRRRL